MREWERIQMLRRELAEKDAEIERLKAALAAEVADLERDLAYYREGTCWGWGTLVKQTERALERLRAALAGEGQEWVTENERVVKWDKEQTAYLRKRLGEAGEGPTA